jgi:hypothetical protein
MPSDKPVCRVGLKGGTGSRRHNLYYLSLEPYWGKPDVRNFREGAGNVSHGGTMNPPHIPKGCVSETLYLQAARAAFLSQATVSLCNDTQKIRATGRSKVLALVVSFRGNERVHLRNTQKSGGIQGIGGR